METSWNKVGDWYGKIVGGKGHYFHQHVILPNSLRLLLLDSQSQVLDVGCGNGWFSHFIPQSCSYLGVDAAASLIDKARQQNTNSNFDFEILDLTKNLKLKIKNYSHALAILSLQNMEKPDIAIKNVASVVASKGKFLLVLNHPMFRIPRQTEWGIDEKNKAQYRRINRYLSPFKIPIVAHPGEKGSPVTWSFHHSLADYSKFLNDAGFAIEVIEEWISDKTSQGPAAKMENFARQEFPMFMAILAVKK